MAKKEPLKNFGGKRCSSEFASAYCHTGSYSILCEACGRVHFVDKDYTDYEDGEYAEYVQGVKDDPERYIARGEDDEPSWGLIFGKQVVADCPCGYAAMIEKSLWNMRYWVMEYYEGRAGRELRAAEHTAGRAADARSAIKAAS